MSRRLIVESLMRALEVIEVEVASQTTAGLAERSIIVQVHQ
jgi:hypothetical protein